MWEGLRTSHDRGMKKIREQPRPLVPTPEIQALLTPFLPRSVAHHHTDKGESEVVPFFHIHVWVFSSLPLCPGSFRCHLFPLLPPQRHRMLLPGCSTSTHPTQPWGHPCLCPSLQPPPGPPAPAPGSQPSFNEHSSAQVCEPRIFSKLGERLVILMRRLAALWRPSFLQGSQTLSPQLHQWVFPALPTLLPPAAQPQACCSPHLLLSVSLTPCPDLSDVLSADTVVGGFLVAQT